MTLGSPPLETPAPACIGRESQEGGHTQRYGAPGRLPKVSTVDTTDGRTRAMPSKFGVRAFVLLAAMATAATALAGCTRTLPHPPSPQQSDDGLVVASNGECETLGRAVLDYLSTGNNRGDPTLDLH